MKLDKTTYNNLRAGMRQEYAHTVRLHKGIHEEHRLLRRISRLDMCFLRNLDWTDFTPGDIISEPVYSTETAGD